MKRDSRKKSPASTHPPPSPLPVPLRAIVRVPIPDVDKGRGDSRNLFAVVLNMTEDGFYHLGTDQGVLKQLYARAEFTVCPKEQMKAEDVPDNEIALRSAPTYKFTGSDQGFVRLMCKTKGQTMRCLSVKKKINCNSKCHSSLPCCNK
ncbi:integrase core domain protein [Plakobranchus ocellatus]|uniref:Integrase core domain protein n=1 Tax=Plakobranchus ocellatus TaxID=259542 RepID=A0AAV4B2M9_9GAST|nr:integrase core domain protein [Plakobranchus ocellatus]